MHEQGACLADGAGRAAEGIYVRHHFSSHLARSAKVRELLFSAMNNCLKDGMTALATQGGVLHVKHPFAAPTAGTGLPMTTMNSRA